MYIAYGAGFKSSDIYGMLQQKIIGISMGNLIPRGYQSDSFWALNSAGLNEI